MLPERNSDVQHVCYNQDGVRAPILNVQLNRRFKLWKAPLGMKYGKNTISNWGESERDGQKIPLYLRCQIHFWLTFSVENVFLPSQKKKKNIFKEIMFTADPREKPCWIRLNGKIIPQDTIGIGLAQGIRNGVGNLSPLGPWFHSGSEWKSKKVINIGWASEWPSWSQLKWQTRILLQTQAISDLTIWPDESPACHLLPGPSSISRTVYPSWPHPDEH